MSPLVDYGAPRNWTFLTSAIPKILIPRYNSAIIFYPCAALEDSEALGYLLAMATTVEQLVKQAMKLPTESRAQLADLLVESLDADGLGHIDRLWLAEAERRRDEVRSGRVETIPGEEALQKVRDVVRR